MKLIIFWMAFLMSCVTPLFSQPAHAERLFVPFMNKESQSNVIVSVSDFGSGQTCPDQFTNSLSNTNLFSLETQEEVRSAFSKYKLVTPTRGPSGTILVDSFKTNYQLKIYNKVVNSEEIISIFQYTNRDGRELIKYGSGLWAEYRNASNDGYNFSFNRTGVGTQLGFGEVKNNKPSGVFVRFEDMHPQGISWSPKDADFIDSRLSEYRQYTNGFVLGKFLMWNVNNGNLLIKAEYTAPYDWKKNLLQPK